MMKIISGLLLCLFWGSAGVGSVQAVTNDVAGLQIYPSLQKPVGQVGQKMALHFDLSNHHQYSLQLKIFVKDVTEVSQAGVPQFGAPTESRYQTWFKGWCQTKSLTDLTCVTDEQSPDQLLELASGQDLPILIWLEIPAAEVIKAHYFGVFFETIPAETTGNLHTVTRVGGLVALTLADQATLQAVQLKLADWESNNLSLIMTNTGTVHLVPSGEAWLTAWWSSRVLDQKTKINSEAHLLLPNLATAFAVSDSTQTDWSIKLYWLHLQLRLDQIGFKERVLPVFFVGTNWLKIGIGLMTITAAGLLAIGLKLVWLKAKTKQSKKN